MRIYIYKYIIYIYIYIYLYKLSSWENAHLPIVVGKRKICVTVSNKKTKFF